MTNWYEKFKNNMSEAIERGWDLRAVNTANAAWECHRLGRITRAQAEEIQAMYDAWMATWDEESAAVEAATLGSLARAGMLAEEPAARDYKIYYNERTQKCTLHAARAMEWHREGDSVRAVTKSGRNDETIKRVSIPGAPQERPLEEDENRAHCRRIALELEAFIDGEVKRCPECGEIHRRDWGDVGDAFKCPNCGEVASVDDWEWLGVYDFLEDALDVEYIVSSSRELRSVRVMVAYGGPTIYIDTDTGNVELYWWSERARYALSSYAVDAVNEWAEEMWRL